LIADGQNWATDRILDEVEYEVTLIILAQLRDSRPNWEEGEPVACCPNPLAYFRSFYMYTMLPHDKSFWAQTRNVWWWFFTVIQLVPVYGVQQICFLFNYLMMDKSDEYQLVTWILGFKTANFISQGIISMIVGVAMYYLCSNKAVHTCHAQGPGQMPGFEIDMIFFAFQILIVWHAYFNRLPYSQKKGTVTLKKRSGGTTVIDTIDTEDDKDCCGYTFYKNRGGSLGYLIAWDAVAFSLCGGLVLWAALAMGVLDKGKLASYNEWRFRAVVYWTRAIYGLLCLPFLCLIIGQALFTHAVPTAYNENGMLVPFLSPQEMLEKKKATGASARKATQVAPAP